MRLFLSSPTHRLIITTPQQRYRGAKTEPHWLALKYIRWLIGDEKGCSGVCHCRPTARTALRVVIILRWAIYAAEGYDWIVDTLSHMWPTRT